jgi:hypothetical protein
MIRSNKREKKEVFIIVKWEFYQARPPKKSPVPPSEEERLDIDNKERKKENSAAEFLPNSEKNAAEFCTLPPIPKHFSFNAKDKLEELKANIRRLERLRLDEKKRQIKGFTEKELEKAIEEAVQNYTQYIADRQ